ncbi:integrase [Stenotrophomonas maltophilia]|uniref:tyrosine-type recombinase/integrase n=1 Tax=Stenotrophomonas maltophilia TaxID=40324 RepID=UPI002B1DA8C3|nr:integrase [Stenotrophomonas maltophilia]
MSRVAIDKARIRASLTPRQGPYWGGPIAPGLTLGLRKTTADSSGSWVARTAAPEGSGKRYLVRSLGNVETGNDYDAARAAAIAWQRQLAAGVDQSGTIDTVRDVCADYVGHLRRKKRDKTADDAARRFERIVDTDPLGDVKLRQLTEKILDAWRERMESGDMKPLPAKKGRPPTVKPMSASAFKRNLTALKAALNYGVAKRYVTKDKAIEWESIKAEKNADGRRDLYLEREQRRALMEAAGPDLRDLIEAVALTGCRPGDPPAMTRSDFDQRTGSVTYRTKDHLRTIELSPAASMLFTRMAAGKKPGDALFTNAGVAWTPAEWSDGIRAAAAAADLPAGVCMYTLRHCWITDAIVGGMDPLTVARLVGTSLDMIQKHYGHLVRGAARDKLAALAFI